jgi:hypothetical protein
MKRAEWVQQSLLSEVHYSNDPTASTLERDRALVERAERFADAIEERSPFDPDESRLRALLAAIEQAKESYAGHPGVEDVYRARLTFAGVKL